MRNKHKTLIAGSGHAGNNAWILVCLEGFAGYVKMWDYPLIF